MTDDTDRIVITAEVDVEAQAPEQTLAPRWEFRPRQNPRWGTVERAGLIIGRGANKKVIPPDDVYKLAALGCTQKEIATWFAIPEETLKYNFYEYMQRAQEETKQRLRRAQITAALAGNVTMLIWLGKNMLGQQENPVNTDTDRVLPWTDL
jgi:hypothetical protein